MRIVEDPLCCYYTNWERHSCKPTLYEGLDRSHEGIVPQCANHAIKAKTNGRYGTTIHIIWIF